MAAPPAPDRVATCWGLVDPLMAAYHDEEWGIPSHDDRHLFELLVLEGFQAGLSWSTILAKRQNFWRAFEGWDAERIAAYGPDDIARLMADAGIVRNRLKVEATIKNARAYLTIRDEFGTFDAYIWTFVGGAPLVRPAPRTFSDVPSTTPESDAVSKALKKRGFTFVGSTICYAFMQAVGMVDDHVAGCPVRSNLKRD
ncbi:MAG TPA: DNA-3-methyladenine glycosylase I [Tepidiformaceae bacterium]|nr:DNA-3-methyladenine glycosylase I [Tepidiformaceae bacterium]